MRIKTLYKCVFTVSQTSVLASTVWVQSYYTHISAYVCIKYIIVVVVVVVVIVIKIIL